jgi:hypothetical protein
MSCIIDAEPSEVLLMIARALRAVFVPTAGSLGLLDIDRANEASIRFEQFSEHGTTVVPFNSIRKESSLGAAPFG